MQQQKLRAIGLSNLFFNIATDSSPQAGQEWLLSRMEHVSKQLFS
jgi:hypothetical protein